MTRGEEIIIQSYDYGKYLLDTGFSTEEAALKCMRVAFIDGARWADAHPRWISVEDEEPPKGQWIITYEPTSPIVVGTDIILPDETADEHNITHWMRLPQAPSSSEKPNNCEKGDKE